MIFFSIHIFAIQSYFVTRRITFRFCVFIMILLLEPLGMLNILSIDNHQNFKLSHLLVYSFLLRAKISIFFVGRTKKVATIEFKWCITGASIFHIIIVKFSYQKKLGPIMLFEINEDFEKSFYCAFWSLNLAISLCRKVVDNFHLIPKK